jgi:hypothetical protein
MPSRSAAKAFNETGGNWRKAFTSTVPELESNDFCYAEKKFPATQCMFSIWHFVIGCQVIRFRD